MPSVTVYCTPSIVINSPALAPAIAIEAAETPASAGIPIEYTLPAIVILSPNFNSSIINVADVAPFISVPLRPASFADKYTSIFSA